jgi:hypothetical protein
VPLLKGVDKTGAVPEAARSATGVFGGVVGTCADCASRAGGVVAILRKVWVGSKMVVAKAKQRQNIHLPPCFPSRLRARELIPIPDRMKYRRIDDVGRG